MSHSQSQVIHRTSSTLPPRLQHGEPTGGAPRTLCSLPTEEAAAGGTAGTAAQPSPEQSDDGGGVQRCAEHARPHRRSGRHGGEGGEVGGPGQGEGGATGVGWAVPARERRVATAERARKLAGEPAVSRESEAEHGREGEQQVGKE